ncbi:MULTISPECIES: hypothetical protein [unclassified Novosphingobium]|uniref:hypothetical protein n=1 Tax=unclassified Novosphingobium TaxID=2644732 RepID=UPI00086C1E09|nr:MULTISPECIES: hypothetical protein [unclassified Novosphingobium]MBN9143726.1 hypothetical protein [Novosphingobium sp.]ODU84338.1 MAG: hypothetical protein ABT10_02850 [Novosphingobium sp. SCN 63-17]OJX92878.1 MAG: hypothetical protein BGP00_23450 [Novosphingobium sp. 63-713]
MSGLLPDFRNASATKSWTNAFVEFPRPANVSEQDWQAMIDHSRETAIAAIETFYRAATSGGDAWQVQMAIANGAELIRLLLRNMQESIWAIAERDGLPVEAKRFSIEWETIEPMKEDGR